MALIVNDTAPRKQYVATAAQDTFAYTFPIYEDSDLVVYLTPVGQAADDAADILTLTTDYTVSGEGTSSGGNVVLVVAATAGDIITIHRDIPVARTSDYQTNGDLQSTSLNDDLDKLVMMVQQQEESIDDRTLKFIETANLAGVDSAVPAPVATQFMRWNAAGTALELVDITGLGSVTLQDIVSKTSDTGSAILPPGTTAERDVAPVNGYLRFNTTLGKGEMYDGAIWAGLGGATGAGGDDIFYENGQNVTTDYTLTTGKNAMSAGDITIDAGVTVTIPTGATWSIV